MGFVGPRPERPSFVEELTRELPFYAERHMVKPGLTGWAQINYPYGASVEDARAKLEYDLYRSEEHTSELQSLMRISYAVFCLKKKKSHLTITNITVQHTDL